MPGLFEKLKRKPVETSHYVPVNSINRYIGREVVILTQGGAGFSDLYKQLDGKIVTVEQDMRDGRALVRTAPDCKFSAKAIMEGKRHNIEHRGGDSFVIPTCFLFSKQ